MKNKLAIVAAAVLSLSAADVVQADGSGEMMLKAKVQSKKAKYKAEAASIDKDFKAERDEFGNGCANINIGNTVTKGMGNVKTEIFIDGDVINAADCR